MSITSRLVTFVLLHPGHSATEITRKLGMTGKPATNSVAASLQRLVERGELRRVAGEGPRGGFTYYPKGSEVTHESEIYTG